MFSRHPSKGCRRFATLASTALLTVAIAGCGNTDSWVEHSPAAGWPAEYADAANSSYTPTRGADALRLEWTRSVKGELFASAALGATGYLGLNAQTEAGCSLMVWEFDNNGRQRWCNRLAQGGGFAGPLFDGFDNLYVGEPGTILSFPPTQWVRWRKPVIGMPLTPRFVGDGRLLVITHLGQLQVLDAQNGLAVGSPVDLVLDVDPTDSQRGLADCLPAEPGCPVAAAPAFDSSSGRLVVNLWQPGAPAPVLKALVYRPTDGSLKPDWESNAVTEGPLASPVFSADGETVYVNGRDKRLWALNAADGTVKWSVPLGYSSQTPPAVTPEGTIVAGGGPDATLIAFRDNGETADRSWQRDNVSPAGTSSLAGEHVGYTVVRAAEDKLSLLVFDPTDGRTINTYSLPNASGGTAGVSVSQDRRVIAASSNGLVYGFVAG